MIIRDPADPPGDGSSGWHVLIFESTSTHYGRRLAQVIPIGPDHEQAVTYALRVIAEHRPEIPAMPRSRQAFQTSPDSWTVRVAGVTKSSTFDVKIAWRVI